MYKINVTTKASVLASFVVSVEVLKTSRCLSDGEFVKGFCVEMAKIFGDDKIGNKFENVPL